MTVLKKASQKAPPYRVASIAKSDSPLGEGGPWCEYILENGVSTINGCRNGTVKQVTQYANELAEELNERQIGARYYAPISRKKVKSK